MSKLFEDLPGKYALASESRALIHQIQQSVLTLLAYMSHISYVDHELAAPKLGTGSIPRPSKLCNPWRNQLAFKNKLQARLAFKDGNPQHKLSLYAMRSNADAKSGIATSN
jgi:hypothetical protein